MIKRAYNLLLSLQRELEADAEVLGCGRIAAGYKSINFYWPTETESDGIKNVNPAAQNGNIYNVAGQAVNGDLQKGLYIKGGKKFIVK